MPTRRKAQQRHRFHRFHRHGTTRVTVRDAEAAVKQQVMRRSNRPNTAHVVPILAPINAQIPEGEFEADLVPKAALLALKPTQNREEPLEKLHTLPTPLVKIAPINQGALPVAPERPRADKPPTMKIRSFEIRRSRSKTRRFGGCF